LTLLLLVVGGTTALTLLVTYFVPTLFPKLKESPYEPAGGAVKSVAFLLYVLIFAFSVGSVLSTGGQASSSAASEATNLALLVRDAKDFTPAVKDKLRAAIGQYDNAVANEEFATMRRGHASAFTAAALDNLYGAYQFYSGTPGPDGSLATSQISKLDAIVTSRRTRLSLAQQGQSGILRAFLIFGTLLVIALSYPLKLSDAWVRMLVLGSIAAFLSFALALTILLDYPFSGDVSVSPQPYKETVLAQFWPRPPLGPVPGDARPLTAQDLVGVWNNIDNKWGEIVFRQVGDKFEASFRHDVGTVVGTIGDDGVFHGWWCEEPGRQAPDKAGEVEWHLRAAQPGQAKGLYGIRRSGTVVDPTQVNWSLTYIGGPEPFDLTPVFSDPSLFCTEGSAPAASPSPTTAASPTPAPAAAAVVPTTSPTPASTPRVPLQGTSGQRSPRRSPTPVPSPTTPMTGVPPPAPTPQPIPSPSLCLLLLPCG
jgi:hypothetical protein